MKKLFTSLTLAAALVAPVLAHAGTIHGDFGIVFNGVSPVTTNASGSFYTANNVSAINFSSADFSMNSGDPQFPTNVTGTITAPPSFVPGGTGFTLVFGNYGTFTQKGTAIQISNAPTRVGSVVSYDLDGNFVPGSYFTAGETGGDSDLILQFNQSGAGYSGSGTFSIQATPAGTPEPSSLALLGTGLLTAVGVARRRFKA